MSSVTLPSAMRNNLLSLRRLSSQMDKTQEILSTGKKVNSAIDNASNFYQARSLTNRAADLMELLNSMDQGIQTIEAANIGLEQGSAFLEQATAVATEAVSQPAVPLSNQAVLVDNVAELAAQGYTVVNSLDEFKAAIATDNAKLVLGCDISYGGDELLEITGANVTINGGGHNFIYTTDEYLRVIGENCSVSNLRIASDRTMPVGNCMFRVDGMGFKMDNVKIDHSGACWSDFYGVYLVNGGELKDVDISIETSNNMPGGVLSENGITDLQNISIKLGAENTYGVGICAFDTARITVDHVGIITRGNGTVYGAFKTSTAEIYGVEKTEKIKEQPETAPLWNGKSNTAAIVEQIGKDALAAWATSQFAPTAALKNDAVFGQGNWYLPAIGELMDVYGTDTSKIAEGDGKSGSIGDNKKLINDALVSLKAAGVEAETLTNYIYWTSSERSNLVSWVFNFSNGIRTGSAEYRNYSVRAFVQVDNVAFSGGRAPQIGDVLYDDQSYGSAADYDPSSGKTAVGVVTWVSDDGSSLKAMNLKDLTFSSRTDKNSFDPDNPYGGQYDTTHHTTLDKYTEDIAGIENYSQVELATAFGTNNLISVDDVNRGSMSVKDIGVFEERYNAVLSEYDKLIADSSYQGTNLLTGGKSEITFNETRSHQFTVAGKDMSAQALGLTTLDWQTQGDIARSLNEIAVALNSIRNFQAELGNNYSIIQTRQDFTEALAEVLETGADDLTLADMNEESANYLMLQTRQQLAVNSLSLAAQSAQSILSVF